MSPLGVLLCRRSCKDLLFLPENRMAQYQQQALLIEAIPGVDGDECGDTTAAVLDSVQLTVTPFEGCSILVFNKDCLDGTTMPCLKHDNQIVRNSCA